MQTVPAYAKFIAAAAAAGLVAAQLAITDDTITKTEWITIALAVLGALGVYAIPNKTEPKP
jgi:hypothetical protein